MQAENGTDVKQRMYFVGALLLVVIDQVTKLLVKGFDVAGISHQGMYLGESIPVLGDVVRLTFVENPGMAFGISFGAAKALLTLATIAIASFLAWYLSKLHVAPRAASIAIMLVFAGAVGNLIDRMFYGVLYGEAPLLYGKVVDFVQVDIPDVTWFGEVYTHWPVFNVADSCVSIGVVMLVLLSSKMPGLSELRPAQPTQGADSGDL
ncbi:MAG: signal peptidase II [Candidatus Kapabacteria bacterium]|nr:signal peptidase II [Candidatus Kapabacteria bacterium]